MSDKASFHLMAKPIGPICNLDCKYCFYLEKENLWKKGENFRMSGDTLEQFTKSYINSQSTEEVTFAWQGGEPTLMGLGFFQQAVVFQKKYADGKSIRNTFQTNGTCLNKNWIDFFEANDFLIGLSIDGPENLHNAFRKQKSGKGSWVKTMEGLNLLRESKVEWNSLTCVHQANENDPLEVYHFLKDHGAVVQQFIPVVEQDSHGNPARWNVSSAGYGTFLNTIFDEWLAKDLGKIFVTNFEDTLGAWMGVEHGICIFEETCGNALALEHDGSVYSCDHYVFPQNKIGNLVTENLSDFAVKEKQQEFGRNKKLYLSQQCKECRLRPLCNGGCPKQRFIKDKYENEGHNYLCKSYMSYFSHTAPHMQLIANMNRNIKPCL